MENYGKCRGIMKNYGKCREIKENVWKIKENVENLTLKLSMSLYLVVIMDIVQKYYIL